MPFTQPVEEDGDRIADLMRQFVQKYAATKSLYSSAGRKIDGSRRMTDRRRDDPASFLAPRVCQQELVHEL
jgi:hypothetical protein